VTIKRAFRVMIGVYIMSFIAHSAAGQNSCVKVAPPQSECYTHFTWWTGNTFWPRNAQCTCAAEPSGYQDCWVTNPACAPAPTGKCPWCGGAPIDFASGDTYFTQSDLKLPGLGGGLALTRTWNSNLSLPSTTATGMFGPGWISNFEENVFVGNDGYMKETLGSGDVYSFGFSGTDSSGNPQFIAAGRGSSQTTTLTQAPSNWTLVLQNGEQHVFDGTSGKLLSITDRNGNVTQLSYDSSFRLVTVTDPASRHLYFTYASPSSYLVTAVTSDFGVSLSYAYDNLGRLAYYTKPDNTTISFQYNDRNAFLITAVLDSNGKILESHTYNTCGQGLTSSRANGVDLITLTYPLSCHLVLSSSPPY
jgi:YD repeat-containing protein